MLQSLDFLVLNFIQSDYIVHAPFPYTLIKHFFFYKRHILLYVYTITFAYEIFLSEQLFNDIDPECGNFIFNVTSFE